MQVIELQNYGDASQLRLSERPKPTPGQGQVVVRIKATSLNPIDPTGASGRMRAMFPLDFPFVPGGDFSGIVDAVGADVSDVAVGDEVYGYSDAGGAYAEWIAVDAGRVALKPSLTHVEAAALALVGQTGMQAIEAAGVRAGQAVLVHGAGGAVGSVAVQYAHHLGARVIGTASVADTPRVLGYGAERVIARDTAFETEVQLANAVIDTVGGDVQARSFQVLRRGGVLVALNQPPSSEQADEHGVRAVMKSTDTSRASLESLRDLIERKLTAPIVGDVYSLKNVALGWEKFAAGEAKGKIVFEP